MATASINVRVDEELKKSAESLFTDLGLNMSTAVTMFLRSAVAYDGIPFELKRPAPSADTVNALAEYARMKSDRQAYPRYDSFEDLLSEVLADA